MPAIALITCYAILHSIYQDDVYSKIQVQINELFDFIGQNDQFKPKMPEY